MKRKKLVILRWELPLLLVLLIVLCRFVPSWAEGYARYVYTVSSAALSFLSSFFPFSLEEILVPAVVLWLVVAPVLHRCKKRTWRYILCREVEVLAWVYIWFYLGWGLNYFRYSIYARASVTPAQYEEQAFKDFLKVYADSLNHAYIPGVRVDTAALGEEVKAFYRNVPAVYGLACPRDYQRPKFFMFTSLYSGVGVLGSMGPFFAESQLNADLPPLQYPFTCAHEFSHLLGVSNEAEANYWAYQVCVHSSFPAVRYSGYFGLLPYVLINATQLLSKEERKAWVETIRPEILADYEEKHSYWEERYNPLIGKAQDCIYDWFLKGNSMPSGKKNYAEVIGMLITMPSVWHIP